MGHRSPRLPAPCPRRSAVARLWTSTPPGWAHKTCANSSRITDDVATPSFFEPYLTSPAGTATASNLSALPLPLPTGSVRDSEDDGQGLRCSPQPPSRVHTTRDHQPVPAARSGPPTATSRTTAGVLTTMINSIWPHEWPHGARGGPSPNLAFADRVPGDSKLPKTRPYRSTRDFRSTSPERESGPVRAWSSTPVHTVC
jgi:hypothetical protein